MTAEDVIRLLQLEPLPHEGGFFRQVYKSSDMLSALHLPGGYTTPHTLGTSIYMVLTPEDFSALHVLKSDETWHFYAGDPLEMLNLHPDGTSRLISIGNGLLHGQQPQFTVPAGIWQGTRLVPGGSWALFGCTVCPGFEWEDFELGQRTDLLARWPKETERITALTRESVA
jgi:predicted cupin superfamily sugar epimerase